jgi:hypothetical protein
MVVPGHEVCVVDSASVARVEARRDGFTIIETLGEAGEVGGTGARPRDQRV